MPYPITFEAAVHFGNLSFAFALESDNELAVHVSDVATGALRGTPVRFHLTDDSAAGLVAADFPGVDSTFFVTNGPGPGAGSITNG